MSAPDGRHPPIDGLRAIAAIAVLLTHVSIYSGLVAAGGDAARYAQRLEVGVAIFFVISGFVLYRPFLQARLDARELPRVGRYGSRRALRIVPAYWLALTVAVVGFSLPRRADAERDRHLLRLRPDLLDGHLPRRARAGLDAVRGGHLLRLPAAVGVGDAAARPGEPARRSARRWSALAAFSLAWKAAFVWSGSPDQVVLSPWLHSLPAYLDHFALGMGLAVLSAWRPLPRWVAARRRRGGAARVLGREPADRDRLRSCSSPTRAGSGWAGTCSTASIGCALVAAALAAVPGRGGGTRARQPHRGLPRHDLLRDLPLAPDRDRRARAPRRAAELASVPVAGGADAACSRCWCRRRAGTGGSVRCCGRARGRGGALRGRQQPTSQQHSEQGEPGQLPVPVDPGVDGVRRQRGRRRREPRAAGGGDHAAEERGERGEPDDRRARPRSPGTASARRGRTRRGRAAAAIRRGTSRCRCP